MGLGKFIKHVVIPGSYEIDMVKNIVDEGSITNGIFRTAKEEITENNPFTKVFYDMGKVDGVKDGYVKASCEYEEKLLRQADEFINQKKHFERERDAYERLLNEYEEVITQLSEKANRTQAENELLQELLLRERRLRALIA